MTDECCGVPEAGSAFCALPSAGVVREAADGFHCPQCGEKGKRVGRPTVRALLARSLRLVEGDYWFCRNEGCDVVYYSELGLSFLTEDLREQVYQKRPHDPDVFVCYCFRHTVGEVTGGSPQGRARILEDITAGIHSAQCACDIRNPQGSCCLGNVKAVVRRADAPVKPTA